MVLARAGFVARSQGDASLGKLPGFTEEFPEVEATDDLFEIDGKRMTCSGGTAAIDLMLHLISESQGEDLAVQVSEQLLHEADSQPRRSSAHGSGLRLGVTHPKLIAIVEAMEQNVEEPLTLKELRGLAGFPRGTWSACSGTIWGIRRLPTTGSYG